MTCWCWPSSVPGDGPGFATVQPHHARQFNPQLAAVRGVAVKSLDYLFVILVTLITVAAVKVIGAILVGALLVIPAAAARLLSQSLKGFFWCSVLIATVSTLCGISRRSSSTCRSPPVPRSFWWLVSPSPWPPSRAASSPA